MDEHVIPERVLSLERLSAHLAVEHQEGGGGGRGGGGRGGEGVACVAVRLDLVGVEAALAAVLGGAEGALEHLENHCFD